MEVIATVQTFLVLSFLLAGSQCSSDAPKGPGVAKQLCAYGMFYCPVDKKCKLNELRCEVLHQACNNEHGLEEKCFRSENVDGAYSVYLGHASPSVDNSSLDHQFIQYRGFTYEFGPSYGVQILDVNDPDYKYKNIHDITRNGIMLEGVSYCNWRDTTLFVNRWKSEDYPLFAANCNKFPIAMKHYLTQGLCRHPRISRK